MKGREREGERGNKKREKGVERLSREGERGWGR